MNHLLHRPVRILQSHALRGSAQPLPASSKRQSRTRPLAMVAVCKDRRAEDCPPCLRISAFTQPWVDLRASAVSRSGAHISASARRSLLKAAIEFARYCNGFDCGCRFPNPRANPFPCFWMAAVQLFPSLQGLLDAVFDAQFLPWRKRGDIGRNWTNTRLL